MKTVTGLFDNYDDASDAVGELEASGIPHSDISIVANNSTDWYDDDSSKAAEDAADGAGVGAIIGGAGGLLTGLGLMAIPGVGPVVAAGWLAATAVGALGGTLVTAKVNDRLVAGAERILRQTKSVNLEERRRAYEAGGWTGFVGDAENYTSNEIEPDRTRSVNRL